MRTKRILASVTVLATTLVASAASGLAEPYPTRPVRIITAGAGTFHDVVARHLARQLGERWQQGVIVDNQPAAGLTIGTAMVAKAPPDGYTLLLGDRTSLSAAPSLYKDLRYDPAKDLRPITLVARAPAILAVHADVPATNLKELIEFAKRQSDPVLFASAGNGTFAHLTGLQFAQLANIRIQPVQFRGGGEAATALLRGDAVFGAIAIPTILPHITAGRAKALAVTSAHRMTAAPGIPTAAEAGLPGLEAEQWLGLLVPAGTLDAIADKIGRDVAEILQSPDIREVLRTQGAEAAPSTPTELATFMRSEAVRLSKLIETAGLRSD
jgi:tripartite-type tricarboxylate transporter receptor subunit TctC